ncbi:MAG: cobalamin-binding protein [candidate division WOR-3 bacterium]|nr:cobalamin-binding protein [candidate division WOR-3 bacterium]
MIQRLLIFLLLIVILNCKESPKTAGLRIVSLSPAMTEVIFAIGAGEYLAGVTTYCDFPDSAKKIYKVGDFSNPSIERIVALKPDFVIINLPEQRKIKNELEKLGIKVFITEPRRLEDIYKEIKELGRIVKKEREADSLMNFMKEIIKPKSKKKKRVYIELSPRPLITIGRDSYLNELIEMAGGENIFADLNKDYPAVKQEEVIMRNPEIIIVFHPEDVVNRLGWGTIRAIKEKRVYRGLNPDYFLRPGPRLVLGFRELEQIFE